MIPSVPADTPAAGAATLKVCNDSSYFQQNVFPLIVNRCDSCHNGTSHTGEDEINFIGKLSGNKIQYKWNYQRNKWNR